MTQRYLYIIDPLDQLNVKTDTTLALMKEAEKRGVRNFACEIGDMALKDGAVLMLAAPVGNASNNGRPVYLQEKTIYQASDFDVVFMRKDPPVDQAFLASLFMLRCAKNEGRKPRLINDPDGLILANEKLFGQKIAPQFFVKTVVSCAKDVLLSFAKAEGRVVIKPLFSRGGEGVLVLEPKDRNLLSALEILTANFSRPLMMQAFIKNARDGDKRIMVVGGKAIGSILRIPNESDHRANFHAGGSPKASILSDREQEIVDFIGPKLVELGLHLVGIDVIDGNLSEINVTSPTCVIEIERLSQKPHERPMRAQILDYVEELIA